MTITLTTLRNTLAAAVLTITAAGCLTSSDSSSSSDQAASTPGDNGTDPGSGTGTGTCQDILDHGCDGLSGEKLEGCKTDIQNAFDQCVKAEACAVVRDEILKGCEPKDEACIAKAEAAYAECIGPADNTQPGK